MPESSLSVEGCTPLLALSWDFGYCLESAFQTNILSFLHHFLGTSTSVNVGNQLLVTFFDKDLLWDHLKRVSFFIKVSHLAALMLFFKAFWLSLCRFHPTAESDSLSACLSVCLSVCFSHLIYWETAESMVVKFGENVRSVNPFTTTGYIILHWI